MSPDDLIAFVDESCKPVRRRDLKALGPRYSYYATAAVVVLRGDVGEIRHQLGQIASHFTKGLHYSSLSRRQRLAALIDVQCISGWDGLVVETSRAVVVRNDRTLRRAVLAEAVLELANVWQVRAITIESRSHPHGHFAKLDRDDSLLVAKLRDARQLSREISVEHASKGEVILGLADLLAGARTDWLCGVDRAPWSVVQHRMQLRSVLPKWTEPRDAEAPGSL